MAWVKLDDDFFSNPKVIRAGKDARDLYLAGLCFCNRGLTDGFIPGEALRRLAADADVDDAPVLASRLIEVGLWIVEEGGYRVHQFLDYQPSGEKVKAERAAAADRMRRLRSPEVRPNIDGTSPEVRPPRPVPSRPVPDPQPVPSEDASSAPEARDKEPYSADFLAFWTAYGPTDGPKRPAFTAWRRLSRADRAAALAGLPAWHTSRQWREGFKPYPQKYLSQRFWETVPDSGPARASPNGTGPPKRHTPYDILAVPTNDEGTLKW